MPTYMVQPPAPVPQRHHKKKISPGECGFLGCTLPRLGGIWKDGGSYLCSKHKNRLMIVRCVFDKFSPEAIAMASKMGGSDYEKQLKREQRTMDRIERERTNVDDG